jgi:hypothetical protein
MYVKIITSSGFKSTILTDFVQGQLRVPFRFGRFLPEVHLFTGSCRLLRRLFNYARGSTQMETKKTKKKIGAEFMTSVSYRPEVINNILVTRNSQLATRTLDNLHFTCFKGMK